jgi:nucleotide-binding universal stress UspA family protein
MSYATIMVNLALDQPNASRLRVAADLAERFGSRAIGIAAADFSPPVYYTSGEPAQEMIDQGLASIRSRLEALESEFRAALAQRCREIEWRSAVDLPSKYIVRQARAADLVIGGGTQGAFVDPFTQADPTDLIMQIGRPLLTVPTDAGPIDLGSVLVAWKDSPEARRAVADALPLLRQAGRVTVAEIVDDEAGRSVAVAGVDDVVAWLARHGIVASGLVPERTDDAMRELDRIAASLGAGVVVAGAYGHSRFREWILGGVTQHLLSQGTRCVLASR